MRVLHVCVCGPYTDGLAYQENELVSQHVDLGYDVTVIAATDTYGQDKKIVHVAPGTSTLQCGARLIRLPYAFGAKGWFASKLRAHQGMSACLESTRPDRILFHGLCAWDLLQVARYVRRHPAVRLLADCHEDFNNSAMSWASRELLHKRFYRSIFQRSLPEISEVLCVTVESLNFATDFYGSPRAKSRIYPLGTVIESAESNARRREQFRRHHGFANDDIVIAQTGKLDRTKKLAEALSAFRATDAARLKFVIAGLMTEDVRRECLPMIRADARITELGWVATDELRTVLAGSDFFLQPFGQTVTTQMAMGYGCAILAQDLPSHRWLVKDNGKLFEDASELSSVFDWVKANEQKITQMREASRGFAARHLDYRQLALQIVA